MINFILHNISNSELLSLISVIGFLIAAINGLTWIPLIFNTLIIPKIELNAGQAIRYPWVISFYPMSRIYCRPVLVAQHIFITFYRYKKKGDIDVVDKGVLTPLGYTIKQMTILEKIMSCILLLNLVVFLVGFFMAAFFYMLTLVVQIDWHLLWVYLKIKYHIR